MQDESYGFTTFGLHHGSDSEARVNLGSEVPLLSIDVRTGGTHVDICPYDAWKGPITEDHERFANELVAAAEQYRDAIVGARLWADFDQPPPDVEGVA